MGSASWPRTGTVHGGRCACVRWVRGDGAAYRCVWGWLLTAAIPSLHPHSCYCSTGASSHSRQGHALSQGLLTMLAPTPTHSVAVHPPVLLRAVGHQAWQSFAWRMRTTWCMHTSGRASGGVGAPPTCADQRRMQDLC